MVKWAGTQNEVSVKGECGHPMSVVFQRVEWLALKAQGSNRSVADRELKAKPHPVRIPDAHRAIRRSSV